VRVGIAEDESLLREGLRALLTTAGFDVVATVGDAPALLLAVDETLPDIVVTDIRMPPNHFDDGLRAAIELRQRHPGTAVMVVSQHVQRRYVDELLRDGNGGVGYLLKLRIADVGQFCSDVRRAAAGGTVVDPEVVKAMMTRATYSWHNVDRLTDRQREVLGLLAEGRSNAAIGERLGLKERGVVQHISNIYEVLDLPDDDDDHRRVLAVLRYLSR
jgi:DNA-binding NarL/FixJ family response regulator